MTPSSFTNAPVSEEIQRIRNINLALKKVCSGQKYIDDVIDTKDANINEATFFNHLLGVFISEKIVKVNIKEFILDSVDARIGW